MASGLNNTFVNGMTPGPGQEQTGVMPDILGSNATNTSDSNEPEGSVVEAQDYTDSDSLTEEKAEEPTITDEGEIGLSGLSKEIEDAILTCYNYYKNEDQGTRNMMIAFWRKLDNFFQSIQRVFYDYGIQDWRRLDFEDSKSFDPTLYDKIINIYRAHGESLIAALSIKPPNVTFYPDDADVAEDVETAKAYDMIWDIIIKHNQSNLLLVKALFILFNQGLVGAYIYNRTNKKYGTVEIPNYGPDVNVSTITHSCPACGGIIDEQVEKDLVTNTIIPIEAQCPNCGAIVESNVEEIKELIPQITGYSERSKSNTVIDLFGPLHAHLPFYAKKFEDAPYLHLRFEQHVNFLRDYYSKLSEANGLPNSGAVSYDAWSRAFTNLQYTYSAHLLTTTCQWLRPWAFECLDNPELIAKMKTKFPKGCYAVIIEDRIVAEGRNEAMDEHWEFTEHPLSHFMHADPLGKPLAPIQELRNIATDLAIETFEHSIPETFADPTVLDFNKYSKEDSKPGMYFPAKAPQGKTLADGFHTIKPATLSEEIELFISKNDTDGQFVLGSFPSIYGGPNTSGSKTASEYSMSRAQALQRLNITWTMLKFWWARIAGRAVTHYANGMLDDEKIVQKATTGTGFVNIWIKQTQLGGKIGKIEPEVDEELPTSFAQNKAVMMELIALNNDIVNEGLFNSQNTPLLAKTIGLPELYIPGKDSRDKQYAEFSELLISGPIAEDQSTVPVDIDVDDHLVEIEACKSFLIGSSGRALKNINPMGRANIIAHLREHIAAQQFLTESQSTTPPGTKPDSSIETVRT